MRKTLVILGFTLAGLYALLHLALGSSPVQKWVLDQIQRALAKYGFELNIESIEFSAFSPKLYLNRVKLATGPRAIIRLNDPLAVDKIKIEFEPLALLSRRIVVDEVILFHPQVFVPRADRLYKRITGLIRENERIELRGSGSLPVIVRKVGIVDALFDVKSTDPEFAIRSRSFSAFLERSTGNQQQISVQSRNLELDRGKTRIAIANLDLDLDLTDSSLRLNRLLVSGENLAVNLKGTSSLPLQRPGKKGPEFMRVSYDLSVPLALLNQIPELKVDGVAGQVKTAGTLTHSGKGLAGSGTLDYENVVFDGYRIGRGKTEFVVDEQKARFTRAELGYAGGEIRSRNLTVGLGERFPIQGDLELQGFLIEGLLDSLKNPGVPVRTSLSGTLKAAGFLAGPLDIQGELSPAKYQGLMVLDRDDRPPTPENRILDFKGGDLTAKIGFTEEQFNFDAQLGLLGGKATASGFVSYENAAKISARLTGVSFTELGHIADLSVGGRTSLVAEVEVNRKDVRAAGTFDIEAAEIADIVLGPTKGQVYFQNRLLSFENLELPSLEPIKGSGYVDFDPDDTRYKFTVDIARSPINQVFDIFQKVKLGFPVPRGGETSARVSIEGGHDRRGIEVLASGRAKGFAWYREDWVNSKFIFTYRPDAIELNRVTLYKKSGALDVQGLFLDDKTRLTLASQSLRVEDFDQVKGAPFAGEIQGEVTLEGTPKDIFAGGFGEAKLLGASFRGQALPDSRLLIRSEGKGVEFLGNLFGDSLRGRYLQGPARTSDELMLYFQRFDLMPVLSLYLQRDVTTLTSILATGDISLKGNLLDWQTLKGSGSLSQFEVGLRGTPLKNRDPVFVRLDGGRVDVAKFHLTGVDGEISGDLRYQLGTSVDANLDGKLDLQYLQAFVPVLDYGVGKTLVSVRLSGRPERFKLLGNIGIEDGALRFTGLKDEFRNVQAQLSLSQDQVNVDRFDAIVTGGRIKAGGAVAIDRFRAFRPRLSIAADRVGLRFRDYLAARLSGDFTLQGGEAPYKLGGQCTILEGNLTRFDTEKTPPPPPDEKPALEFDVTCDADDKLFVRTDIMDAEFRGRFQVLGDTHKLGVVGRAESLRGSVLFRETRFALENANVRFNSPVAIEPRFRVSGRALVKEQKAVTPIEYEIVLQVYGTPEDYKILLSSNPQLTENDILSLLLLGVTSRDEANYMGQLGTTLAGQVPLGSKVGQELGVDIKFASQPVTNQAAPSGPTAPDSTVPTVQIQKKITQGTKVSITNSLDATSLRELRVEQLLDENLTVNATTVNRQRGASEAPTQSYGIDFRFRFQFD